MNEIHTITRKNAIELLNITAKSWSNIKNSLSEIKRGTYLKSDIDELLYMQSLFLDNHMDVAEINTIFTRTNIKILESVPIPPYANTGKFKCSRIAYNKSDIEKHISKGYAKVEYYLDNNLCCDKFKEFENTSFDEFCELYYNFDEINAMLTQKLRNAAPSIVVPFHFRKGKFEDKVSAYKKSIIDKYRDENSEGKIPFMDLDISNYVTINESAELVGATPQIWADIRKILGIQSYRCKDNSNMYVLRCDIDKYIASYNSFYKEHCTYNDAMELLSYPHFDNLKRLDLPQEFRIKDFYKKKYCYSREEINLKIKNGYGKVSINIDNYYYWKDIITILDISKQIFKRACNEFKIEPITYEGKVYYNKSDINLIKEAYEEFAQNHLTSLELNDEFRHCFKSLETQQFKINIPEWLKFGKFTQSDTAYKRDEFLKFYSIKKDYDAFLEPISTSNVLDDFRNRLEIYPYFKYKDLKENHPFATKLLHDFFDSKLLTTGSSAKTLTKRVRLFVKVFEIIFNLIQENNSKDIHTLKTSDILNFINKIDTPAIVNTLVLPFLKYSHAQITGNLKASVASKNIFNIDIITKMLTYEVERKELLNADIYDIETFLEMIYYCRDINFHIKKVLEEINDFETVYYVSYWLFVSINLNNAWRAGDISCFPLIDISDILDHFQIYEINWFSNNTLSLEQSRLILSRLYAHNYIISKTKLYNEFFISDDLSISVATCIAILTLFRNTLAICDHNYLMFFYTDFNYPNDHSFGKFFKYFKIKDFKFKSNKTGSTLMTFVQSIKIDDSAEEMLKLASNLRGHSNLMSTLNYLKVDADTLNTLSRNLFKRGEFGYIYCAIANRLGINTNTLKQPELIDQTILLSDTIESPFDLEIMSSKLNTYEKNTKCILSKINTMNFKEIREKFVNLTLKGSPSNKKDVQCFIGVENCPYKNTTEKSDCLICHNGIPTLYALNAIAKELVHLLISYQNSTFLGEKFKLSNAIGHYKQRMLEAIKEYGHEIVYTYIQLDPNDFRYLIDCIDDIDDLLERNIYHIC